MNLDDHRGAEAFMGVYRQPLPNLFGIRDSCNYKYANSIWFVLPNLRLQNSSHTFKDMIQATDYTTVWKLDDVLSSTNYALYNRKTASTFTG